MATVTQPPVMRKPKPVKRSLKPADEPLKTAAPEQATEVKLPTDEQVRRDRWTSIAILVAILALMGLLLFLAGIQTPGTPAPPHWTDWPMM